MNILATSFGSAGDFLPTLAVASALHGRGHRVRFVANPAFEAQVRHSGVPFVPAGALCDLAAAFEANPKYLHSLTGGRAVWNDFAAPNVMATYAAVTEAISSLRPDVVLCNNVSFGGVWAARERGVRYVLVAATPLAWINPRAPTIASEWIPPRWLQPWIGRAAHWAADKVLSRSLTKLAGNLGTIPDPSFRGVEANATLHLGMWSPMLRRRLPGDPPGSVVCGFARAGHFAGGECLPEVEAFFTSGPPPVVVGLGSAYAFTSGPLLRTIAEACEHAGLRCLIVGHPAAEANFAGSALAVRYAPYDVVFPRAAAIVIHGGAGTTSEALRSGRPVLALPFAFDQFQMANEVEASGAGIWVRKRDRSLDGIAGALTRLVSDARFVQRALDLAGCLAREPDGAAAAAELIEQLPLE
jgi:rhamnosyltransferase subunit B